MGVITQAKTHFLDLKALYFQIIEAKNITKTILPLLKPTILNFVMTYILMLLQVGVSLLIPKYTGGIIDIVTRSKDENELQEHCIKMFIVTITSHYMSLFSTKVKQKTFVSLDVALKSETYKRLLQCDLEYFDKKTSRELMNILNGGIHGMIKFWFERSRAFINAGGSLIAGFYIMYQTYPKLMLLALGILFIKLALPYFGFKKQREDMKKLNKIERNINDLPRQALENILLIKTFSTEAKEYKELAEVYDQLDKLEMMSFKSGWLFNTASSVIDKIMDSSLIWYGGILVFQGAITVGDLSTFNMYSMTFRNAVSRIKSQFAALQRSDHMATLMEFLQIVLKIEAKTSKNITKSDLEGDIEIKNVSFSYITKPDVQVLKDISLKINKGQSVAIVGANGSGKTTLSYLLQGLYTPKEGVIMIDGEDVQNYNAKWLHRRMGYVSQEPVLLEKSIKKNLVYGLHEESTDEQIEKALTMANARFILDKKKFIDGVETRLGTGEDDDEDGVKKRVKLSGGQRQRIAIARAFIKDPKILILDEPTSALDGESESKVQKAIDDFTSLGNRTVIVIAHRLSTIINCDKIVVMDDGKIVEEGTHKELFAKDGVYKRLFEFQINSLKNV